MEIALPIGCQANDNALTELGSAQRSRRGRSKEPSQGSLLIDGRERPVVRASRRRKDETYARWENLILPMRFAVRMNGWEKVSGSAG